MNNRVIAAVQSILYRLGIPNPTKNSEQALATIESRVTAELSRHTRAILSSTDPSIFWPHAIEIYQILTQRFRGFNNDASKTARARVIDFLGILEEYAPNSIIRLSYTQREIAQEVIENWGLKK